MDINEETEERQIWKSEIGLVNALFRPDREAGAR